VTASAARGPARAALLGLAALLCLPAQGLYGRWREPPATGAIYLYTRPSGAEVLWSTVDVEGLRLLPVGRTPGPLRLTYRQFPALLVLRLAGYRDYTLHLPAGVYGPHSRRYPAAGALALEPALPLLAPLAYSLRDLPFLYAGGLLLALAGWQAGALARLRRQEQRMARRLALGDLGPGVALGPYLLGPRLGSGGQATVFLARRREEPESAPVALKVLLRRLAADPEARRRFQQEIEICRGFLHPHALALLDWGEWEGYPYLVMEYEEGETLAALLERGPVPALQAVRWARQVAQALAAAHARGIVHRDVKPGNILITPRGKARLMDFGIARRLDLPALTPAGEALGTPGYAPPEQIQGQGADWRGDYYSLGMVLYEALAGAHPFAGASPLEVLTLQVQQGPPPLEKPRPDLPGELTSLVRRLLDKDPRRRAATSEEVARSLEEIEGRLAG
jgi:hypothetical protein